MLNRLLLAASIACLSGAIAPARAAAQGVQLQLGGGVAIPVGRFDTTYTSGPAGLIAITDGGSESSIGLRLDYSYNSFRGKTVNGKRYRDAHMNVVTGNVVLSLPTGPYIKPYALVGLGWYPYREATETKRKNDWGANVGGGLTFPIPFSAAGGFIEARYHRVFGGGVQARRFVPIMVGVTL